MHDHNHDHAAQRARSGQGAPVLDIGDDVGALVLLTTEADLGREIEVSLVTAPERRTHVEVLPRPNGERVLFAAVYGGLVAGTYRIWDDQPGRVHEVDVRGGEVTQLDWT